jgi:hypothetical protein
MPWGEQRKALADLRKNPKVSRAYSHQVNITGNKRYSKADYPNCQTVMGDTSLHIVVEADCNGSIGRGSAKEIEHSLACGRPVWLCDQSGDFLKFDEEVIIKTEKDFLRWWINDQECYGTLTYIIHKEFGEIRSSTSFNDKPFYHKKANSSLENNNENYYY